MASAIGIFVFAMGTVGETLAFYVTFAQNFFFAGCTVVLVQTLIWPHATQRVFPQRLAAVYADLEDAMPPRGAANTFRRVAAAGSIRCGVGRAPAATRAAAPEVRPGPDSSHPIARLILACRALNLRLWFFNEAVAPALPATLSTEARQQLAGLLDQCAEHLQALLEAILQGNQVLPLGLDPAQAALLAPGVPDAVLRRVLQDLQAVTTSQNALLLSVRKGIHGEFVVPAPLARGKRLVDINSVHAGTKMVLIVVLLLVEEGLLGFWGGSQVAFFAVFFASIGNLGRQNMTALFGLAGIVAGFVYGILAAFLTSRLPHFPLVLALVFLGEFLANMAFQRLPRYAPVGLQAGLALPYAYLITTGPEWGSFSDLRTRFWGLVVAAFTAVVVHAFLWPVLPMRQLRASIAAALRATAASIAQLFRGPRGTWEGAPPSLAETVSRASDLLNDARYLPGTEHSDPAYNRIRGYLQEIDANLEFVHFLISLEEEHPLRQRFFQVIGDYAEQAQSNLERLAQQFQEPPARAARVDPVHWETDTSARWEIAFREVGPVADRKIDPLRQAVIARGLDQIARAVEKISGIAREINLRNSGR